MSEDWDPALENEAMELAEEALRIEAIEEMERRSEELYAQYLAEVAEEELEESRKVNPENCSHPQYAIQRANYLTPYGDVEGVEWCEDCQEVL